MAGMVFPVYHLHAANAGLLISLDYIGKLPGKYKEAAGTILRSYRDYIGKLPVLYCKVPGIYQEAPPTMQIKFS